MYLDASAIIAVLTKEDDAGYLVAKLERATKPIHCSSLTVFEAVISLARRITNEQHGDQTPIPPTVIDEAQTYVDALLEALRVREIEISGTTHRRAVEAARTFGKFVAHAARLNMGDCFVYACAKEYHLPLLFKGDDFTKTDIEIV
jgi:ribonuclease VapC